MMSLSRMIPLGLVAVGLGTTGCSTWHSPFGNPSQSARSDDGAALKEPGAGGGAARDSGRLADNRNTRPDEAAHYYVNQQVAMVARPARYDEKELARVEVWWTDNNGFHWHKAGHFEQGRTSFPLDVNEDGDYGIRFVGPGDEPAQRVLAFPERTYHIDTVKPTVQVMIDPEKDEYHVDDLVSIDWMAQDMHLDKRPVTIEVLYDRGDADTGPIEFQRDLPSEGSVSYRIPPQALGRKITFRVEARDRADNLGVAHTVALRVVDNPMAVELAKADIEESKTDAKENETDVTHESVAVVSREPEVTPDVAVPAEEESREQNAAVAVGPILVLAEDAIEHAVEHIKETAVAAAHAQRDRNETRLAESARLAEELKGRATMLASRAVEAMGGIVDGWVASAKVASAKDAAMREAAPTQPPAPVAVAAVEAGSAEPEPVADVEAPDQTQAAQTAPIFAAVEQPVDKPAEDAAVTQPLVASTGQADAAQARVEESSAKSTGSTFLEIGPQIVMAEEPFEHEPAPAALPSDDATAVATIGEADDDANSDDDASPAEPQMKQRPQETPSFATSDEDMADEAEDAPTVRVAQTSPTLPYATAIARLPSDDTQLMNQVSAAEATPADSAATNVTDVTEPQTETIETASDMDDQDIDAKPEVSAVASAEQESADEQQLADAAVAEDQSPAMNEDVQANDAAEIETVASAEQIDDEEPILPAESIESLIAVDPTRGNGLLIPLPATLEDEEPPLRVTAHPWRILGRQPDATDKAIWSLPEREGDINWRPVFTDRFPADGPTPRNVAEHDRVNAPTLAGTTEEAIDGEPSDEP